MGGFSPLYHSPISCFLTEPLFFRHFPNLACSLLPYFNRSPPGLRRAPNKQNESGSILYEEPSHYGGGIRLYSCCC